MKAPGWFTKKLKALDSRLRVRWSNIEHVWFIEEKLPFDKRLSPLGAKHPEPRKRRSEGYALVIGLRKLDWRAFAHLYHMDVKRYGSADKYCDWLEEEEAKMEQQQNREDASLIDDVGHEAFDRVLWSTQNKGRKVESANVI